jgi:hypothetical protein
MRARILVDVRRSSREYPISAQTYQHRADDNERLAEQRPI